MRPGLHICHPEELLESVAGRVAEILRGAEAPSIVLAGGRTPRALYGKLAQMPHRANIPWSRLRVFWGDERCVGPEDPQSNFGMAHEALLAHVRPGAVFRMEGELDPEEAAERYERVIRRTFSLGSREWPRFSLVLLGMGEDGHTASLFPGSEVLTERERIVRAVVVPQRGVQRITLTVPAIAHAAEVLVLVTGSAKAGVVRDVIGKRDRGSPISLITPVSGHMRWYLDDEAASLLKGVT